MNNRITWSQFQGKKILSADFSGLISERNLVEQVEQTLRFINEKCDSNSLIFIDITNTNNSVKSQIKFTEAAKQIERKSKKVAVIGLTPVKNLVLGVINKLTSLVIKPFKDKESAYKWLIA